MKSVRANSLKVCGGKRPEWPSISATLPSSFSTTARQADANLWERDRPGRLVPGPAEHILRCSSRAGRETLPEATGKSEQHKSGPTHRIAEHARLLAFIRGCIPSFWKFQKQLMQVVDFHDIFRYFQVPRCFRWNRAGPTEASQEIPQTRSCPALYKPSPYSPGSRGGDGLPRT